MPEQLHNAQLLGGVVLYDQQTAQPRAAEVLEPVEGALQFIRSAGLGDKRKRPAFQTVLALVLHRENLYRDMAGGAIALEVIKYGPAQHVGQKHVERDGCEWIFDRQRERVGAGSGQQHLEPTLARQAQEQAP